MQSQRASLTVDGGKIRLENKLPSNEDRGQTDRVIVLVRLVTLILNRRP